MNGGYRLVFGSARAEKDIIAFLERLPRSYQQRLHDAMAALGCNPRPPQAQPLRGAVRLYGHTATYRLRAGVYRVLYDVDDAARRVVILAVRRRSEKTYH